MSRLLQLGIAAVLLICPIVAQGQEEDVSLGDLARTLRKAAPGDESKVIDNENLPIMMDKAEAERLNGRPVFSIDPSGKTFRVTSPDGSCSLSFDAKATALISTPYTSSSLPLDELDRLDGTASIHDGVIEVLLHNGTAWELKEIVVGVTLLNPRATLLRSANLLGPGDGELVPKTPDVTMLYHLKATALPDGTTEFRGNLDQELGPTSDWHWALVGARGVPPAAPSATLLPSSVSSPSVSTPQIQPIAGTHQSVATPTPAADPKP
jgi:hypothetical protein